MDFRRIPATLTAVLLLCNSPIVAADAPYDRAIALERAGRLDDAIATLQAEIVNQRGNHLYLATAAHLEFNRGWHQRALSDAVRAIEIESVPWYNVVAARAAFALGKFQESRKYAARACEVGRLALGDANYETSNEILHQSDPREITLAWHLKSAHQLTVTVPPAELPHQKTKIEVKNGRIVRDYEKNGNHVIDVVADSATGAELVTRFSRTPLEDQLRLTRGDSRTTPQQDEDAKKYLGPSEKIGLNAPTLKRIANETKAAATVETVQNILQWMNGNLRYTVSEFSQAEDVVKRGYGECWGWSSVFTALCRLNGIPARNVWGPANYPGFAPEGFFKGHTWAEFYLPGAGWIEVEPQYPGLLGTLPSHYLRVAHATMDEGWGTVMNLPDTMKIVNRIYAP